MRVFLKKCSEWNRDKLFGMKGISSAGNCRVSCMTWVQYNTEEPQTAVWIQRASRHHRMGLDPKRIMFPVYSSTAVVVLSPCFMTEIICSATRASNSISTVLVIAAPSRSSFLVSLLSNFLCFFPFSRSERWLCFSQPLLLLLSQLYDVAIDEKPLTSLGVPLHSPHPPQHGLLTHNSSTSLNPLSPSSFFTPPCLPLDFKALHSLTNLSSFAKCPILATFSHYFRLSVHSTCSASVPLASSDCCCHTSGFNLRLTNPTNTSARVQS